MPAQTHSSGALPRALIALAFGVGCCTLTARADAQQTDPYGAGQFVHAYDPNVPHLPSGSDPVSLGFAAESHYAAQAPPSASVQSRLERLESELAALKGEQPPTFEVPSTARQPSPTQYPTFNWSGFLQVDTAWWYQDQANEESVGSIESKTGLRRVRLRASGNVRSTTTYVVDLDFAASGHPSFRDVMLRFHEFSILQNVDFGYFQQPFSMNALTSGQELVFMERWLPFAFAPFRQTGLAARGVSDSRRAQWAVSVYRFPTDSYGSSIGDNGGFAVAGRFTFLPLYQDNGRRLIHVGACYSFGDPGDDLVEYRIQPGFFVSESSGSAEGDGGTGVPVFVDTGKIPTDGYHLFNAELAGNFGPFHLQSEVTVAIVDQLGGPTLGFSGAYAQVGYYLTGETRPYDLNRGVFRHPLVLREYDPQRGGWGAWEVAAGWSYIDLNDNNIHGGLLNGYSLALNWYLNPLTDLKFDIMHSFLNDSEGRHSESVTVGVRAQFKF